MAANIGEFPETAVKPSATDRTLDALRQAAHLSHEAELLKSMTADAVEDAVHAAKVGLKRGTRRLEDLKDEAVTRVRRRPLAFVIAAFGIGMGLGLVAGLLKPRART
jgi:hypothetical protein